MEELDILYRDEHFVAVHKPSGLLVHRSWIDRHETRFAVQLVRDQVGCRVYPAHRLDKPTSGVLFFGLSPEAGRALTTLFSSRSVTKTYLAVARGLVPDAGVIDHPLPEVEDRLERANFCEKDPQPAVTAFRRLASVELDAAVGRYPTSRYSLVEIHPETGRRHQVRRHFKSMFHPLIGDTKYGEGRHNRYFREAFQSSRLLLAAVEVGFDHPFTAEPLRVSAPLEEGFASLVARLGWTQALPQRWLAPAGEGGA